MSNTYQSQLTEAMMLLADGSGPNKYTIVGQGAQDGGHGMCSTFENVSLEQRIEVPVFEETQSGLALGMALDGLNIISIYPRVDFFISGLSQFLNHSDKVVKMSNGRFRPNLIFRVGVGAKTPLDGGPQHTNNYTEQFEAMTTNVTVKEILKDDDPLEVYCSAASVGGIYLLIEHYDLYGANVCGD